MSLKSYHQLNSLLLDNGKTDITLRRNIRANGDIDLRTPDGEVWMMKEISNTNGRYWSLVLVRSIPEISDPTMRKQGAMGYQLPPRAYRDSDMVMRSNDHSTRFSLLSDNEAANFPSSSYQTPKNSKKNSYIEEFENGRFVTKRKQADIDMSESVDMSDDTLNARKRRFNDDVSNTRSLMDNKRRSSIAESEKSEVGVLAPQKKAQKMITVSEESYKNLLLMSIGKKPINNSSDDERNISDILEPVSSKSDKSDDTNNADSTKASINNNDK